MIIPALLVALWLTASAFVVPQPLHAAVATAAAGLVSAAAIVLARDHRLTRFLVTGAALAAAGVAILLPWAPRAVALHHAIVVPLLLALTVVQPQRLRSEGARASHA